MSPKSAFLISSRMQKEIQCVGSGLAYDKLKEQGELAMRYQTKFVYNSFHGERDDPNSIGLVETIISGAGIVEDMYFRRETEEIVDPKTPTRTPPSSLQMKDICTLEPGKAYIIGKLVTAARRLSVLQRSQAT
jgi:hypothetical protein